MNRHQPTAAQSVQRQEEEEEVQTKRLIQREAAPEEEEIQTKPLLQRQAAPEEEEVQTKPLIQRRGEGGFEAGSDLEQRLAASRGSGNPLPGEVRDYMEPRFGADFSGVRVHTGGEAVQMNRDLSAQAFTHGQDIYMGEGKYKPNSDAGKQLLAHELTHVVQQTGSATASPSESVQRMELGEAKTPKPSKSWMSNGGFDSKHLLMSALSEEAAKKRYVERFTKERARGRRRNTVVAADNLKAAITGGNVSGAYPTARSGKREPMIVKVKGYTVSGNSDRTGKQVAGAAVEVSQIGVEGSGTESIFFPDHLVGELSA